MLYPDGLVYFSIKSLSLNPTIRAYPPNVNPNKFGNIDEVIKVMLFKIWNDSVGLQIIIMIKKMKGIVKHTLNGHFRKVL